MEGKHKGRYELLRQQRNSAGQDKSGRPVGVKSVSPGLTERLVRKVSKGKTKDMPPTSYALETGHSIRSQTVRMVDGERRSEHSFLLHEPAPSESRSVEHSFSAAQRDFGSPIPPHSKRKVPHNYHPPDLDVSVLELKAEIAHLASQLQAATKDSESSALINQKLRRALEEELSRNDDLQSQVTQNDTMSRLQLSTISDKYESRLQMREKEFFELSEEYVLSLELQKKEIEERDSRLHEIFEEVTLKQEELVYNDITSRARFAEFLARQAILGWRHELRLVRRRFKLARRQVLRRLRQRAFSEWKLLAKRGLTDVALVQHCALSDGTVDARRLPQKDRLLLLAETGQSLFLQTRQETRYKQRAFSCLASEARREIRFREHDVRSKCLRTFVSWRERSRIQQMWASKSYRACVQRHDRLRAAEVFQDWNRIVRYRQLARGGQYGWKINSDQPSHAFEKPGQGKAVPPRKQQDTSTSASTYFEGRSQTWSFRSRREDLRVLQCLSLMIKNKVRATLLQAMLGWAWVSRNSKVLNHRTHHAHTVARSTTQSRHFHAWCRLVHTWKMWREIFARQLCSPVEWAWQRWTQWWRAERRERGAGRLILSETFKSWRILAAATSSSRDRAMGMAGRWGMRITRVRLGFWRAWTWRWKLLRVALWRFEGKRQRATMRRAITGWASALAAVASLAERAETRRRRQCLRTWRGAVQWRKRKAMLERRAGKVEERWRDLATYNAMLAWYTLANSPGSLRVHGIADGHYRQRALRIVFYHWVVHLEHTALMALGVERRAFKAWRGERERAWRQRETGCKALRWVADRALLLRALLSWGTRGTRYALLLLARRWMSRSFQVWQSSTFRGRSSLLDALRGIDNALGRALLPPGQKSKSLMVVQPPAISILQASLDMKQRQYDENADHWNLRASQPGRRELSPASSFNGVLATHSPIRGADFSGEVSVSSAALVRQIVGSTP